MMFINEVKQTQFSLYNVKLIVSLYTIEAKEGVSCRANFLLDSEMVIQRHLLHSCQQAFV